MRSIGVLIVGQSAVVREQIGDAVRTQTGMHIVGTAADGRRGLKSVEQLRPDVVFLDTQMPGFDGLETLDSLLLARAVPVVMVCDPTAADAELTLAALEHGAQDVLLKPPAGTPLDPNFADDVVRKIRAVAGLDIRRILQRRRDQNDRRLPRTANGGTFAKRRAAPTPIPACYGDACIVISAALGGPTALATILAQLRGPLPPLAVALDMPPDLTTALVKRLAALTTLEVKEAAGGDELVPNRVLVAPGGKHLQVRRRNGKVTAQVIEFEPVSGNCPSADVLLHSVAEIFGAGTLGVLLSGRGRDGVAGCAAVKACGGFVLGQDEASSDFYGMNEAAFLEGYVDRQCSLDNMANELMQFVADRFAGKSSS